MKVWTIVLSLLAAGAGLPIAALQNPVGAGATTLSQPDPKERQRRDDLARETSRLAALTRTAVTILQPQPILTVDAIYPAIARDNRLAGVVSVQAEIDEGGLVVSAIAVRSVPLFDRAALEAVRSWRFPPITVGGEPVRYTVVVPVPFAPD